MTSWEMAKLQLRTTVFPAAEFKRRVYAAKESKAKSKNGTVMNDPRWYGVYKTARTHKLGRGDKHRSIKTAVSNLFDIHGFPVDGYELYCHT